MKSEERHIFNKRCLADIGGIAGHSVRGKRTNIIAIVALLAGCTSLDERADKYYEAELYPEAIRIYEKSLAKDPSDQGALKGIAKAKRKYAEQKILQARMSRIGGNQQNSLNLLSEATQLLASTNQMVEGRVLSSLEEERSGGFRYFNENISAALKSNLPLKALDFFQTYSSIFSEPQNISNLESIRSRISIAGKGQCKVLRDSGRSDLGFFAEFSVSFCKVWEGHKRSPATDGKLKQSGLYGNVSLSLHVDGASSSANSEIKRQLKESFDSSKWYSPSGKRVAAIRVIGRVTRTSHQEPDIKMKQYTESVPFTTEARTIYKNISRSHAYSGYNHTQFLFLTLTGSLHLMESDIPLAISEKLEETSFVHNNSIPAIGLYPEGDRSTSQDDFLASKSKILADTMKSKLNELWKNLYCAPKNKNISIAETGEQVLRCLSAHDSNAPPAFVNIWFTKQFGLKADRTIQLLELRS
jgi:tetratricopeptide (TPR) repeat protein